MKKDFIIDIQNLISVLLRQLISVSVVIFEIIMDGGMDVSISLVNVYKLLRDGFQKFRMNFFELKLPSFFSFLDVFFRFDEVRVILDER
jgi:hypothetical protein